MSLRRAINLSPQENPEEPEQTWDHDRGPPTPSEVDWQNQKGCDRAADRRPTVEESCSQSALLFREPLRHSFRCRGPVRRLSRAEQEPEQPEAIKPIRQRCED